MEINEPLPGPGRFQWNMGGWFGIQLGGTSWMLIGAVVLVPYAPKVAGIWLACFAVANAIGFWMWCHRDWLRPYPALQALLLVCGVNGLTALVALHVLRITRPMGIYLPDEPRSIRWLLVLVISLMTWFHVMEQSAKKERRRAEGHTSP